MFKRSSQKKYLDLEIEYGQLNKKYKQCLNDINDERNSMNYVYEKHKIEIHNLNCKIAKLQDNCHILNYELYVMNLKSESYKWILIFICCLISLFYVYKIYGTTFLYSLSNIA